MGAQRRHAPILKNFRSTSCSLASLVWLLEVPLLFSLDVVGMCCCLLLLLLMLQFIAAAVVGCLCCFFFAESDRRLR